MAPPPPPPRRPPDLMEEIFEEMLLRFPPDDPASLVRAALVSKRWCRLIAGSRFRRRFRELHRAPPILGFICNVLMRVRNMDRQHKARFVPTSSCLTQADCPRWRAFDARHGRVLLYRCADFSQGEDWLHPFIVWDPVTGEELQLPSLPMDRCYPFPVGFNAAVLCAGGHLDGHFLVVFVGMYPDGMVAYEYSSEAGVWSEPTILQRPCEYVDLVPAAVVGNAVYFRFDDGTRILKYDLGTREMGFNTSQYDSIPLNTTQNEQALERIILMTTDEGRLGFTMVDYNCKLYLWSMEVVGPRDDAVWTQDRVIELRDFLPADELLSEPCVLGYVNGHGAIFVGTKDGFYTIDLKSNQTKKVGRGLACMKNSNEDIFYGHNYVISDMCLLFPYTSFLFPALEAVSATAGPSAGASGA
ncbi:unnamed protein product [Urochloa decumbens]|uniref:F-box domain-containing protein n=1 Tax=Urochloa decumbens TaxID=240449 RepID=A0ABC9FNC9_9POAL